MGLKFTILGCANSYGVPYAGNDWGDCDPNEVRNRRTRCSLLVQSENTSIVIDTGADFREQMNIHKVNTLDAVLYTHKHSDHTAGIDDLRIYAIRNKAPLCAYLDSDTLDYIRTSRDYILETKVKEYPAMLTTHTVDPYSDFTINNDLKVQTHSLNHGSIISMGYRFGDVAYSLDMKDITDSRSFDALYGIKTWIVDAGAYKSEHNPVHATFDRIIELNQKVKASRVILTSLSNRIDYKQASSELPDGYEIAYDGMKIKS